VEVGARDFDIEMLFKELREFGVNITPKKTLRAQIRRKAAM
jgi:hypothetical protein